MTWRWSRATRWRIAEALSAGAHIVREATIAPAHLLGSVGELRSALGNLLSNAVRFFYAAGSRITLNVAARERRKSSLK